MSTARWCSGLTHRPVTAEIVGSNPIRVATSQLSPLPCGERRVDSKGRMNRAAFLLVGAPEIGLGGRTRYPSATRPSRSLSQHNVGCAADHDVGQGCKYQPVASTARRVGTANPRPPSTLESYPPLMEQSFTRLAVTISKPVTTSGPLGSKSGFTYPQDLRQTPRWSCQDLRQCEPRGTALSRAPDPLRPLRPAAPLCLDPPCTC